MKLISIIAFLFLFSIINAQDVASQFGSVDATAISLNGKYGASSHEHDIIIWELSTGYPILKTNVSPTHSSISNLFFSDDGAKLVCISNAENASCVLDVATGDIQRMPGITSKYNRGFVRKDQTQFITTRSDDRFQKEICLISFSGEIVWKYEVSADTRINGWFYIPASDMIMFYTETISGGSPSVYSIKVGESSPRFLFKSFKPIVFFEKDESKFFALCGDSSETTKFKKTAICLMDLNGHIEWKYSADYGNEIMSASYLPASGRVIFMTKSSSDYANIYTIKAGSNSTEMIASFQVNNSFGKSDFFFCDSEENHLFVHCKAPFMLDLKTKDVLWKADGTDPYLFHSHAPSKYYDLRCDVYDCPLAKFYTVMGGGFSKSGDEFFITVSQDERITFVSYDTKTQSRLNLSKVNKSTLSGNWNNQANLFRPFDNLALIRYSNKVGDKLHSTTLQVVDYSAGQALKVLFESSVTESLSKAKLEYAIALDERLAAQREEYEKRLKEPQVNPDFAYVKIGDYLKFEGSLYSVFFGAGSDVLLATNSYSGRERSFINTDKFSLVKPSDKIVCYKCSWKSNACPICGGKSNTGSGTTTRTYTTDVYKTEIDQYGNATKIWDGTKTVTVDNPNSNPGPCLRCGGTGIVLSDCKNCNGRGWVLK